MAIPFKSSIVLGQIFAQNDDWRVLCGGKQELSISKSGVNKSITLGAVESGSGTLTTLTTRINGGVYTNSGYLSIDAVNSTLYHNIGINLNSNYGQFTMNGTSGVTLNSKSSKPININSVNDLNINASGSIALGTSNSGNITITRKNLIFYTKGWALNGYGTDGQVLISKGENATPQWGSPFTIIPRISAGASGSNEFFTYDLPNYETWYDERFIVKKGTYGKVIVDIAGKTSTSAQYGTNLGYAYIEWIWPNDSDSCLLFNEGYTSRFGFYPTGFTNTSLESGDIRLQCDSSDYNNYRYLSVTITYGIACKI